ncbi:ATP-binding cassette domain-containing protein [Desulfobotulus sp. H1]|uniref:ATP-binding cassette domain-containing protein n=1 Tax=Desulfobotulus pelophilus TaxID=2823377 RepID=A0ABT3NBN3_9BACT|nr:ATP-binding cassette domain-containing protein [Desulfobotulus pelophilus]MCW7754872.1 ATP-binding cassette domain-containing protein [Desulfobotulus pelophilus]
MIRLEGIVKTFHGGTADENPVFSGLELAIPEGSFVTVIGSNGAGKSTLLNLISGKIFADAGRVVINGMDMGREPEHRRARYIGRIFQDPLAGTAATMSVEDNLMIAARKGFRGLRISLNAKRRVLFRDHLSRLGMGLENRMRDNVGLLSGGQRQALTLLMMVMSRPSLILLDEHTAALDPRNAARVMDLTCSFVQDYGLTTLMVTHNMAHAIRYGNRLLMMDGGKIVLDIAGEEKTSLTVEGLVKRFADLGATASDALLLARSGA